MFNESQYRVHQQYLYLAAFAISYSSSQNIDRKPSKNIERGNHTHLRTSKGSYQFVIWKPPWIQPSLMEKN
jgi:hypothetical protein